MKPQFALVFADDTVSLLARHDYGWMKHGQVALHDNADLTSGMAALRDKAIELGGPEFTTKLVIPASQILYTAVHAPGPTVAERRRQIEAALVGMTPYPVEDLVFDWSGPGKTVHVAVIARITLREAEDFAESHGLRPVAFAALPKSEEFPGEPWFGPTTYAPEFLAQGDQVEPDDTAIVICTPEEGAAALAAAQAAAEAAEAEARQAEEARLEEERLAQERLEAERREQERLEFERLEAERREQERLEFERLEAERREQERLEFERLEAERREHERLELERLEAERREQERLEAERQARAEADRLRASQPAQDYEPAEATADMQSAQSMAMPQWEDDPAEVSPSASSHADRPTRSALVEELSVYGQEPTEEERHLAEYGSDFGAEAGPYTENDFAESPQAASAQIDAAEKSKTSPQQGWQNGGSDRISIPESDLDRLRAEFGVERPADMPGKDSTLAATKTAAEQTGSGRKLSGARRDEPAVGHSPLLQASRETDEKGPAKNERKEGTLRKPVASSEAVATADNPSQSAPATAAASAGRVSITARIGRKSDEEEEAETTSFDDLSARVGGKPKYLGLMLTGVLILVLAILAMLLGDDPDSENLPALQESSAIAPENTADDTVVADMTTPAVAEEPPTNTSATAATETPQTTATVTEAPASAPQPSATGSIDTLDAPETRDPRPTVPEAPPPYNQLARIQPDGTVTPTAEGVLMPGDYLLVAGTPPRVPRARPQDVTFAYTEATGKPMPYQAPSLKGKTPRLRPDSVLKAAETAAKAPASAAQAASASAIAPTDPQPGAPKPAARPENAQDTAKPETAKPEAETATATDRATPLPSADPRLSSASPLRARPATVTEAATAQAEAERRAAEERAAAEEAAREAEAAQATASDQAVTVSRRPLGRPQNFSNAVQAALAAAMANRPAATPAAAPAPQPQKAAAAAPAPRRQAQPEAEADDEPEAQPAPNMPTSASVAKAATSDNAIKLNQVNLIGVYGGTNSRRALLRMPNGRFVKVQIGDSFDGGRVTAINDKSLTYQKGSRAYQINLIDG